MFVTAKLGAGKLTLAFRRYAYGPDTTGTVGGALKATLRARFAGVLRQRRPPRFERRCLSLSSSDRKRASPQSRSEDGVTGKELLSEIERFRKAAETNSAGSQDQRSATLTEGLRAWATNLLTADAFLVLFFMGWLAVGVALKLTVGHSAILDVWYTLWQPVVQPLIGLLIIGAIASNFLRG